jgi:phosphoribosylglycinamide formyltransferase-1
LNGLGENRTLRVRKRSNKLKLVVLISGGGSNLQAMIDQIEAGKLDGEIKMVVSNNPEAYGLTRAQMYGIPTAVVDYSKYGRELLPKVDESRLPSQFNEVMSRQRIFRGLPPEKIRDQLARLVLAEQEIIEMLNPLAPEVICLAGFMRLISPYFIEHYSNEERYGIMNIHPALLPAFPGTDGYGDTFAYGCRFGGITVHFVDEGEDTGPIIAQAAYPIWPDDTLDLVKKRGLELEYALYSQCIQWVAQGNLLVEKGKDGRPRVHIQDPEYPKFIQQLTQQAFRR